MFLHEIEIKQFRCFSHEKFSFHKPITVIVGNNGTGKTSLVEAIHYLCYMKSFRCHTTSDLICHAYDSFFLKGSFSPEDTMLDEHTIQVGYAGKKKAIRVDDKAISTYKDIFSLFQVVTLLEDDIDLIKGYPSARRSFVDQAVLFMQDHYLEVYRTFKRTLQSRNALLHQGSFDPLEMEVWTEKLWKTSVLIQKQRIRALQEIEVILNELLKKYFDNVYRITIQYEPKYSKLDESFDAFQKRMTYLFRQERLSKRSQFGAHLDDFVVQLDGKNARTFASRGQQKLLALLCKLSLISLAKQNALSPILIIDDFVADFDEKRITNIINFFVNSKNQVIMTTPFYDSDLKRIIERADPDVLFMKN